MREVAAALYALAGGGLFCGSIMLLVWMHHRHRQRLRRMEQEERFRLIDAGLADRLSEPASWVRQQTELERIRAVGAIGVAAALGTMGAVAALSVALLLAERDGYWGFWNFGVWVLILVWFMAVVLLGIVFGGCLDALRRKSEPVTTQPDVPAPHRVGPSGIKEKPTL